MDTQDWYTVNEFAPGSYQITEGGRFNMLLLVGDEKALSIDGGTKNLGYAVVRETVAPLFSGDASAVLTSAAPLDAHRLRLVVNEHECWPK